MDSFSLIRDLGKRKLIVKDLYESPISYESRLIATFTGSVSDMIRAGVKPSNIPKILTTRSKIMDMLYQ